jgi:mono/diheme cytochrome c family protein
VKTINTFATVWIATVLLIITECSCSSKTNPQPQPQVKTGNERNYFLQNCASCHGADGGGTALGVPLRARQLDPDYIKKTILNGSIRMPRFILIDPFLTDFSQWIHNMK